MKAPVRIVFFWINIIILSCALAGCSTPAVQTKRMKSTQPQKPRIVKPDIPGQEIAGKWRIVGSSARFEIGFAGNDIYIKGWDSSDKEEFLIAGVEWDGKRLTGAFKMPSTRYTTYSELELVDKDTLQGIYKSADGSGEEIWKRE